MAYDAAKAHEYYEKYRKKGIKKGRKKGSGKKSNKGTKTSLLGLSSSGLNDNGKIEAGIIKDRIKKEMNEALAKAKTPEEKERIRAEYSKKAQAEINALKNNPQYAKPKAQKAGGASKQAKASSGKSSGSGKSSASSSKSSGSSAKSASSASAKIDTATINKIKKQIETMREMMSRSSSGQKKRLVEAMSLLLDTLKSLRGVSESEEKEYRAEINGQRKETDR